MLSALFNDPATIGTVVIIGLLLFRKDIEFSKYRFYMCAGLALVAIGKITS